jgi:hypothetical protein
MAELPAPEQRCTAKLAVYVTEDEHNQLVVFCQRMGFNSISELGRILFRRTLAEQERQDSEARKADH